MRNILLVEDDSFLIEIYSGKLKEEGFSVEVVSKGEDVLPKAKEKNLI
jgi:CheY-like chemotaxis protein